MRQSYFDANGQPLTEEQALDANRCIKDGVRVRVPLMMRDSAMSDPHRVLTADERADRQDRLDQVLSNRWRKPGSIPDVMNDLAALERRPPIKDGTPDMAAVYDRYDQRLQSRWRA